MAPDPRTLFVLELAPPLLTALVLARAAAFKLRDPTAFVDAAEAYRAGPAVVVRPLARALPWAELALAAALVTPWLRGAADITAAGLLTLFAGAMGLNLMRGRREIDCGCGDPARRQPLSWALVGRNLVLALLLLAAGAMPPGRPSLGGALVAVAGAAGGLLLIRCQEAFSALPARRPARMAIIPDGGGRR